MTRHLLRARLVAWRRAELAVTNLVADIRRRWPNPDYPLCDELLDRLDEIDGLLDHVARVTEAIEVDLRSERAA